MHSTGAEPGRDGWPATTAGTTTDILMATEGAQYPCEAGDMRRTEREIVDRRRIEEVIGDAVVCRLGLADGGEPYVVPVCFGYRDRRIYVHSAPEGTKIEILRKNPRVCFEVDRMDGVIGAANPCGWEVRYRSVIGTGTAVFLEDPGEKAEALAIIVARYGGNASSFPAEALGRVAVLRIDVDSITGKEYWP